MDTVNRRGARVTDQTQPKPLRPADLCAVPFEPSPLFDQMAQEYRAAHPVIVPWRDLPPERRDVRTIEAGLKAFESEQFAALKRAGAPTPTKPSPAVIAERERLRAAHTADFNDGFRMGAIGPSEGEKRLPGNYPIGFRDWPQNRRNAWFAGWMQGFVYAEGADHD